MKKLLLIAVLVVSANIAFAQDKYEFMTISLEYVNGSGGELTTSINGKDFVSEKISLPKEYKNTSNTNPLLSKVLEYQDKGWEVMTFSSSVSSLYLHFAYLRKKKN